VLCYRERFAGDMVIFVIKSYQHIIHKFINTKTPYKINANNTYSHCSQFQSHKNKKLFTISRKLFTLFTITHIYSHCYNILSVFNFTTFYSDFCQYTVQSLAVVHIFTWHFAFTHFALFL